jgi:hypothetical protein
MSVDLLPKALLSLDEAYTQAEKGPIPKSAHLRLTLAVLSEFLPDRDPLDQFWKVATNPPLSENTAQQFGRRQSLRNAYMRIYVALGLEAPS